jgi:glycosyltransferase involved in cell wall biosynthesis
MSDLISVIIPAYNKSEELRASLASLLSQTYKNYEVIIVNDGSTDNTAHIIDEFKDTFWRRKIRFKIILQNNQGSNAARNRGLLERRGDLLIFWDADVVAAPNMLASMQDALAAHPEKSYAYSSFIYGKKKFKLWEFSSEKLRQMPFIHTTSLTRTGDFPGWDKRIRRLQDWDVWLTMLEKGQTGVWVPEFLFTVLTEHGAISSWLPKIVYRLPFVKLAKVEEYKEAVEVIRKKHKL